MKIYSIITSQAKESLNGQELDGRRMRVDYSITKRPHTPTPGIYMGKPTRLVIGVCVCTHHLQSKYLPSPFPQEMAIWISVLL